MMLRLAALPLLLACSGKSTDGEGPVDTSVDPTDDTSGPDDTRGPDDTADSGDTGDTGEVGWDTHDWSHCEGQETAVGDYRGTVTLTANAVYCSAWNEERTLEEELAVKSMLRLQPGALAVPVDEGSFPLELPVCTLFGVSAAGPGPDGVGSTEVSHSEAGGQRYTSLIGSQPMGEGDWTLLHTLLLTGPEGADPDPLTLDGGLRDLETGGGVALTLVPAGVESYDLSAHSYGACVEETWVRNLHTITFEGGAVALTLNLGDNITNTAPGSFSSAVGTLDGVDFEVTEFFQLIYRPGHHHFSRHFALLFDAPIGEACGLRIEEVDAYAEAPTAIVSLTDCALGVLSTRETLEQAFE